MFGSFCSLLILSICSLVPATIRLVASTVCFIAAGIVCFFGKNIGRGFFGEYSARVYIMTLVMCGSMAFSSFAYGEYYVKASQNALNDSDEELTVYLTDRSEGYLLLENGKKIKCAVNSDTGFNECYRRFTLYGTVKDISEYAENTAYYKAKGILVVCSGEHTATGEKVNGVFAFFYKMRSYAVRCAEKFCGEQAGFVSGLAFGDKNAIPNDVYACFKRTGTSHICAVSGMHLAAVLALVGTLLTHALPIGRVKHAVLLLLTVSYVLFTGASLSVTRAGIMYALFLLSFFGGQTPDSLTSLSFAAHIILLFEPYAYADIGLVFSLSATFGIVVFASPIIKSLKRYMSGKDLPPFWDKLLYSVASAVAVSLCASLGVIVPLALYYGSFYPFSTVTTLLLSPSVTATLCLAPLFVAFSFCEPVAMLAGTVCEAFAGFTVSTARFCMSFSDISVSLDYFFTPFFLAATAVVTGVLVIKKASYGRYIRCLCVSLVVYIVLACVANSFYSSESYVITKCTDNGDIICAVFEQKAIICDYGTGEDVTQLSRITEMLRKKGITKLDSYVVARTNDNNVNSVRYICSQLSLDSLYIPDVHGENDDTEAEFEKYAEACGARLIKYFPSGNTRLSDSETEISLCGTYTLDGERLAPLYIQNGKKLLYIPYPSFGAVSAVKKLADENTEVIYGSVTSDKVPFVMLHNVGKTYITQYLRDELAGNEYESIMKSGCEEIIRGDTDIIMLSEK